MPPVARYPSTSQAAVTILCPHCQALGRCLAEHSVILGGAAVVVADGVATRCLGTLLKGTASLGVGLGEVEQQGGTVSADHPRALDQQVGDTLGVTEESSEAGGGDDGEHRSLGWWGAVVPPDVVIIADRGWLSRVGSQFPKWHSVAVADLPAAPAATLAVVFLLADLDGEQALAAAVGCPALGGVAGEGAAVAGVPDGVRFGEGHRSVSVADSVIIGADQCPSCSI